MEKPYRVATDEGVIWVTPPPPPPPPSKLEQRIGELVSDATVVLGPIALAVVAVWAALKLFCR